MHTNEEKGELVKKIINFPFYIYIKTDVPAKGIGAKNIPCLTDFNEQWRYVES